MFAKVLLIAALALIAWAVAGPGFPRRGAGAAVHGQAGRHALVDRRRHYAGDPRDAIYRIDRRNHLGRSLIVPGQRLVLPSAR